MKIYHVYEETEEIKSFKSKEKALEYIYSILGEDEIENKEDVDAGEDYPYGYNKYGNHVFMQEGELVD